MRTRKCAVCGKEKAIARFGNGIRCPATTCLDCKENRLESVEPKTIMFVKRIVKETV